MLNPVSTKDWFIVFLDSTADPAYFAFMRKDGAYYIMQLDEGESTVLYYFGSGGVTPLTLDWGNKSTLDYTTPELSGGDI